MISWIAWRFSGDQGCRPTGIRRRRQTLIPNLLPAPSKHHTSTLAGSGTGASETWYEAYRPPKGGS